MKHRFYYIYIILWLCIFGLFSPTLALAQITVTDVIMAFKPESKPVHNVYVGNSSEEMMYVTAEVAKIERNEKGEELRLPTTDLLVAPKRFSVKGKDRRTVRLLLRTRPQEIEATYRISFVPQVNPHEEDNLKKGVNIRMVTGMGMLIFAEPASPRHTLTWERNGDKLKFINSGNTNLKLRELQFCDIPLKNDNIENLNETDDIKCDKYNKAINRLYPNDSVEIVVPKDKSIVLQKDANDEIEKVIIPPTH